MAFVVNRDRDAWVYTGTLAVAPDGGVGPPRELLTDVHEADWTPDGRDLLVARQQGNETTIELPPGNVIARRSGFVTFLRISPDGRHAVSWDGGSLELLDIARRSTRALLSGIGPVMWGLAWAASGREVWFTVGSRFANEIVATDLEDRRRLVDRSRVDLSLLDISADGRALLHRSVCSESVTASLPPSGLERDVSVAGTSVVAVLSADGKKMLVSASGPSRGTQTYLRSDGAGPMHLAEGLPLDPSPGGRLALLQQDRNVVVVPVGPDLPRKIESAVRQPAGAVFVPPDGSRVLVWGRERDADPARLV